MKIIGIAGTNGSGKDSVGKILQEDHGFLFISVTDILRDELINSGQTLERENLRGLGNKWRKQYGVGALINKAIEIYKAKDGNYKGLAIASLRNPGELERVHELGGKVVWVDADPKIRYERIIGRLRSAEDQKTYEEFLAEETAEMQSGEDETNLHMAGVKAKSDIKIRNEGDFGSFKKAIDKMVLTI